MIHMLTVSQQTRNHQLGTVADSVDSRVLDNNALVGSEKGLQWADDGSQVALIALVVVKPLGVQDIVQSDKALLFVHGTTSDTSQLLHVSSNTQKETQVNAESSDVGSGFAGNPEDTELSLVVKLVKLALVDGSDTELTLDGTDKRWALEQSTSQSLEGAGKLLLASGKLVVESDDADILLTSTLLGLDQTSSTVNADNQTSGDFGIEGTGVASSVNAEDALDPSNNFVGGRVGGLVEVDDTAGDVRLEIALERSRAGRNWGEVTGANKDWKGTESANFNLKILHTARNTASSMKKPK